LRYIILLKHLFIKESNIIYAFVVFVACCLLFVAVVVVEVVEVMVGVGWGGG